MIQNHDIYILAREAFYSRFVEAVKTCFYAYVPECRTLEKYAVIYMIEPSPISLDSKIFLVCGYKNHKYHLKLETLNTDRVIRLHAQMMGKQLADALLFIVRADSANTVMTQ